VTLGIAVGDVKIDQQIKRLVTVILIKSYQKLESNSLADKNKFKI